MKKYCVYIHTSPVGKSYIGITSQKPEYRWGKDGRNYRTHKRLWNAIQKHGWHNFEHVIWANDLAENQAFEMEKRLIALFDTTNENNGYNISTGGDSGANGVKWSKEAADRHSKVLREKWSKEPHFNLGKKASLETRKKLSEARKGEKNHNFGKRMHDAQKEKIRTAHLGKKLSAETKEKLKKSKEKYRKPVICVETGFLYESLKDASAHTGARSDHISECCRGNTNRKTAAGYHWKYKKG